MPMLDKLLFRISPSSPDFSETINWLKSIEFPWIQFYDFEPGFRSEIVTSRISYEGKAPLLSTIEGEKCLIVTDGVFQPNYGVRVFDFISVKNADLASPKFILAPLHDLEDATNPPIGMEKWEKQLPKKPEYGWILSTINTPVFLTGVSDYPTAKRILQNTSIAGIDVSLLKRDEILRLLHDD